MVTQIDTATARAKHEAGAQFLEVLPATDFRAEHLPGAVNVPLPELTADAALGALDRDRPVVVYCFDTQCDLSGRAAARLERFGFAEVYDYTGSKAAWLGMGLPTEGSTPAGTRAGALARPAATCPPDATLDRLPEPGPGGVVLVVDGDVVLGSIDPARLPDADGRLTALDVAHPGPISVRPSITVDELATSMDDAGESWVVVSTLDGALTGVVERGDLGVDR